VTTDDLRFDDDPAVIAAAVRGLTTDVHRALTRAEAGGSGGHDEALAGLQRRADDLLDRVSEDRLSGLRPWIASLQRRILIMQWLDDSPGDPAAIGGREQTGLCA
jgi:hypothetical protein